MSNDCKPASKRQITKEVPSFVAVFLDRFEAFIYSTRWSLMFVNLGLVAALIVYLGRFAVDDYEVLTTGWHQSTEDVRVLLLGLVDTALVANLMVMIIQGSHQIFIRRFHVDAGDRPQWLDHIDSGILKVKVALSIAGITLIQILKDFVHLESVSWELVVHSMIVHCVCLVSALVLALIWRVTHPTANHGGQAAHSEGGAPKACNPSDATSEPAADSSHPGHH
jgi:uncharacterized protein (TIGR00645 family)